MYKRQGFPHTTEGLELSDDQLVNFLLLCHQYQYGVGEEQQEEMMEEEEMMEDHHGDDVKVKVMKIGSSDNIQEIMNKMLGG